MRKFDLHIHTSRYSPDSIIDPYELVERALAIGLDGIVITEHDTLWPEAELNELRRRAPNLIILAGVEIAAKGGDVLCYGIRDISRLPRGVEWKVLIEEVSSQGGCAVAAHPYRWGQNFDRLMQENPGLHGLEMMSNNMTRELRKAASDYYARFPQLTRLGNSDAHEIDVLGICHTVFEMDITCNADLIKAIELGLARPVPSRPQPN
ncbi:MAG: PHP domain-containing protein [Gemmataceae bacterium]|jgi:predicted metal-dependent phosphoesterase TrpH|nr:PHP domain-containing protein [Gemmataceae bacterium]